MRRWLREYGPTAACWLAVWAVFCAMWLLPFWLALAVDAVLLAWLFKR